MNFGDQAVDLRLCFTRQPVTVDLPVVGHPDGDDSTIRIGERRDRLAEGSDAEPLLELDVVTLPGEQVGELGGGDDHRHGIGVRPVEGWI